MHIDQKSSAQFTEHSLRGVIEERPEETALALALALALVTSNGSQRVSIRICKSNKYWKYCSNAHNLESVLLVISLSLMARTSYQQKSERRSEEWTLHWRPEESNEWLAIKGSKHIEPFIGAQVALMACPVAVPVIGSCPHPCLWPDVQF